MDSQSNAEIISRLTTTLGKSKETLAEEAEKEAEKNNPANFGLNFGYFFAQPYIFALKEQQQLKKYG